MFRHDAETRFTRWLATTPKEGIMTDQIIAGIFAKLPQPETRWLAADRVVWLRAMELAFRLVYGLRPGQPDMEITIGLARDEPEPSPFAWPTLPNTWGAL